MFISLALPAASSVLLQPGSQTAYAGTANMTFDHGRLKGKIIQISLEWNNEDKYCEWGLQSHSLLNWFFLFNFALTKTLHLPLILQLPSCLEVWLVSYARTVQVAVEFSSSVVHRLKTS